MRFRPPVGMSNNTTTISADSVADGARYDLTTRRPLPLPTPQASDDYHRRAERQQLYRAVLAADDAHLATNPLEGDRTRLHRPDLRSRMGMPPGVSARIEGDVHDLRIGVRALLRVSVAGERARAEQRRGHP